MSDENDYPITREGFAKRGVPKPLQEYLLAEMRAADAARERRRVVEEMIFPPKVRR